MAERKFTMPTLPEVLMRSPGHMVEGLSFMILSSGFGAFISERLAHTDEGGLPGLIAGVVLFMLLNGRQDFSMEKPEDIPTPYQQLEKAAQDHPGAAQLLVSLHGGELRIRPESLLKQTISDQADNQTALAALFSSENFGGLFSPDERFLQVAIHTVVLEDGKVTHAEVYTTKSLNGNPVEDKRSFSVNEKGIPSFNRPVTRRPVGSLGGYATMTGRVHF